MTIPLRIIQPHYVYNGLCDMSTEVVEMQDRWVLRVTVNGILNQEVHVFNEREINPTMKYMVNFEHTFGNIQRGVR